ncbi:MAG TPA: hypothetical protein VE262_21860 [Blastocatellia bacterium]|nr:hypothetical protein [Blastocatellia bacterium]
MDMFLQVGHGMMDHCTRLIKEWKGGSVILSPRDLDDGQLKKLSKKIRRLDGNVLLDPQFYLPHSDHRRLSSHSYWPKSYATSGFWSGNDLETLISDLQSLNRDLGCADFLLPGLLALDIDSDWLDRQKAIINVANRLNDDEFNLISTVALSADSARSEEQIHTVLEGLEEWQVSGIYLVSEHPKGEYLSQDAIWLANILDLAAGARLKGKKVIIGYSSHQMLIAACASVSAIAAGTWMNVRSFPPEKFNQQYEDEVKHRATWYYCSQALSEYKVTFLDIAQKQGVLDVMKNSPDSGSDYAGVLFQGPQPTSIDFSEQSAFRHYLSTLHAQVKAARLSTFDQTVDQYKATLDNAEAILHQLQSAGVKGQQRDFSEIIDINRAALAVLCDTRGPLLRRYWDRLL